MQKLLILNKLFILVFFLSSLSQIKAQVKSDNDLIFSTVNYKSVYESKRNVTYLFEGKHPLVKYNPISLFFGGMLFLYQKTISVQIGAACPYEINCSQFSKQCIQKYGIWKGIPLTADRLTRCTKLAGIDMVEGVDYNSRTHKIYDKPSDYQKKKKQ